MGKNHPSVRAWNHYKNSGFRHSTPKHVFILDLLPFWVLPVSLSRLMCLKPLFLHSGFRHTTKTHLGVLTWNHYKNSGFRHSAQKHVSTREAQKVKFRWRNLALRRSTQRPLGKVPFFLLLRMTSRNPYFCSVFGTSRSGIVKNAFFWKPLKTRDRKKKCIFDIFERVFAGHETPIFVVF